MLADPTTSSELTNDCLFELPLALEVDPFDASVIDAEIGVAKVFDEARVVTSQRLGLNEQC
jgi:hypothetical protein